MTIYTSPDNFIDRTPSVAQRTGTALGQGLGSGLKMLIENKVKKMAAQDKWAKIQAILGGNQAQPIGGESTQDKGTQIQALLGGNQAQPIGGEAKSTSSQDITKSPFQQEITDEKILAINEIDSNLGKVLQTQKQGREKVREARAKREFERVKPVLARADERAEAITQKESSLSLMKDALAEGNLGFFSPDSLAEITGIEGFRTAKGAQFISSGKEYFLGSLKRAGARPNQWIERQIQKMLPKIGRSRAANLTVIEALESELSVEKEQLNIIDRLSQEDEEKFGYIRGNLAQRVRKELKSFADKEQINLEARLKDIESPQKDPANSEIQETEIFMIDREGKRRAVDKKDAKAAKNAGYRLSQ